MTKNTTQNTSHLSAKQRKPQRSDLPIAQKPHEHDEMPSDERLLKLPDDIVKIFLMTDLPSWTFKLNGTNGQEHIHDAFTAPVDVWVQWASQYADLDVRADWNDLEERAEFLTQLWTYC